MKHIDEMLWKYGLRYAEVIKKIPFLRRIAEYSYWGLAIKRVSPEAPKVLRQAEKATADEMRSEASTVVRENGTQRWADFYSGEAGETFLQENIEHHDYFFRLVEQYARRKTEGIPSLVEIGVGTGTMSIFFSRRSFDVLGIDDEPYVVARAIERNKRLGGYAKFMCIEASKLSDFFKEGSFDVAFSQGTLEHFDDTRIKRLINAQMKVARYVVFSVPSIHWPNAEFGNERRMTLEEWRSILSEPGFSIEHISYYQKGDLHIAVVMRGDQHQ